MTLHLAVERLSVRRGGSDIVFGANLELLAGELVALLGPSGSGKSTLLRAMIGFSPGSGRVLFRGRDLYAEFESLKSEIGFVPQDDVLHTSLSVEKTLAYAAALRLRPDLEESARSGAVTAVLSHVELADRRSQMVKRLSGGQRKRVAVAVELLAKPPLLFLDEPTSGLDPALEEKMMALFRRLTTKERITVLSTHILASLSVVDLLVIIAKGRIAFIGPPAEAKPFFGVSDLADIYKKLGERPPLEWAQKLEASSLYKTYLLDRRAGRSR